MPKGWSRGAVWVATTCLAGLGGLARLHAPGQCRGQRPCLWDPLVILVLMVLVRVVLVMLPVPAWVLLPLVRLPPLLPLVPAWPVALLTCCICHAAPS